MVQQARVWSTSRASTVQLVPGGSAAVKCFNSKQNFHCKKDLQADMQVSSGCDDCWSSYILFAMDGLTQSFMIKERLPKFEPFGLSRFVVDLRERHLDYWTPYYDMHPQECNSKH